MLNQCSTIPRNGITACYFLRLFGFVFFCFSFCLFLLILIRLFSFPLKPKQVPWEYLVHFGRQLLHFTIFRPDKNETNLKASFWELFRTKFINHFSKLSSSISSLMCADFCLNISFSSTRDSS